MTWFWTKGPGPAWIEQSGVSYVGAYGAKGDGTTDDTTAIQAAITAAKGTGTTFASPLRGQSVVRMPTGVYVVNSPLLLYSGVVLQGVGQATSIKAGSSFSGTALVVMTGSPFCECAGLSNLELSGTSATAVAATAADVVTCTFQNLFLNTSEGLIFDNTYVQGCLFDGLYSYGPINRLLHVKGNYNVARWIDKEGSSGTSTDPYIIFETHTVGQYSTGNLLQDVLLEGTCNANKSGIKLSGVDQMIVRDVWWEPTASDGYLARIIASKEVRFEGYLHGLVAASGKLKVDTTREVWVERFDEDGEDAAFNGAIELDATSSLHIRSVQSRRGTDVYRLDKMARQSVDFHFNRQEYSDAVTGYVPVQQAQYLTPQNLFVNPSFEAGRYGWTFGEAPSTTEEYVQSEVGDGLMGHFKWSTTGSREIRQSITVPAAWIGQTMTLAALVKITGVNFIAPYLSGAGIAVQTGYQRVSAGSGWCLLTQTFVPQSAGALLCGIYFVSVDSTTDVYVDESYLGFGTQGIPNPSKATSVELGGKTRAVAAVVPATGTWKVGDMVFNSAPAEAGSAASKYVSTGWVCTVAGSPGTWLEMRTLTGN